MAKDKERSVNPAAAQRKAEKSRAIKKGKAAIAAQRTERLAHINPARIERQITDLHAKQASQGSLPTRERKQLEDLERDLARIHKARESHGGRFGGSGTRGTKRTRDEQDHTGGQNKKPARWGGPEESESSETDDSARNIPMPKDTPPPIPTRRRGLDRASGVEPLRGTTDKDEVTAIAPTESKTVYEAKPIIKDLRKEAVSFVPSAVRKKITATQGEGGKLLEVDELDALEQQGYGTKPAGSTSKADIKPRDIKENVSTHQRPALQVEIEDVSDEAL